MSSYKTLSSDLKFYRLSFNLAGYKIRQITNLKGATKQRRLYLA